MQASKFDSAVGVHCPLLFVLSFLFAICRLFFISAVSECETIMKVQFSATIDEGEGKCQAFSRQAMLTQTANCELFAVGRRLCREL